MKTNAIGQQGQFGNGDGYHTHGGQAGDGVGNQVYGTRVDTAAPVGAPGVAAGAPGVVAGTPFLVSSPEPMPPVVHLPPQYVPQHQPGPYVPQAPYAPPPPPPLQPAGHGPFSVPQMPFAGTAMGGGQQMPAFLGGPPQPSVFPNGIPQLPPTLMQQPGSALPPYNVQLPALSLTARSPSGQYVVPMPPKLYVDDKPNDTAAASSTQDRGKNDKQQ